jgi:glycosyltransferase involved in cell wall biosynthesis
VSDTEENLDVIQRDGKSYGFTFRNKDVGDLAGQLKHLIERPEIVEEMRTPGHNYVFQNFSWDEASRMTYEIYTHVLGDRG